MAHMPLQNSISASSTRPKRILVCVTGLSPQIVTETLYALAVASPKPWIPHEIHLITTQRGADNARLNLLSDSPGWFHRLCREWSLPAIAFSADHIHVIQDSHGRSLEDIRNDIDNNSAANSIANLIRELTQNDQTEVHASIAGGRKTMGFFMGYAMSLWGRSQDTLSHVLVSSPFESRSEFFYPTRESHILPARLPGQDTVDAKDAKVWLGEIPFVRLRGLLPNSLKHNNSGFDQAITAINQTLDQVELHIDVRAQALRINHTRIALPPMQFAWLCLLAWRRLNHLPPLSAPSKEFSDADWNAQVLSNLTSAMGELNIPESLYARLQNDTPIGDSFSQQLSKLEKAVRDSGALPTQQLIERQALAPRGRQRGYSLALSTTHIHLHR